MPLIPSQIDFRSFALHQANKPTGGGVAVLPTPDELAPGGWTDEGFWVTGTAYLADELIEYEVDAEGQPRYFMCSTGHTAGGSTQPLDGASWEDYWVECSDAGVAVKAQAQFLPGGSSYAWSCNIGSAFTGQFIINPGATPVVVSGSDTLSATLGAAELHTVRVWGTNVANTFRWGGSAASVAILEQVDSYLPTTTDLTNAFVGGACHALVKGITDTVETVGDIWVAAGRVDSWELDASNDMSGVVSILDWLNTPDVAASVVLPSSLQGILNPVIAESAFQAFDIAGSNLNNFIRVCTDWTNATNLTNAFTGAALLQNGVDYILDRCVTGGKTNVILGIDVAGEVEPSTQGWADIDTLVSRGWTVTHNGSNFNYNTSPEDQAGWVTYTATAPDNDGALAPNGTMTADAIISADSDTLQSRYKPIGTVPVGIITISFFAKPNGYNYANISLDKGTDYMAATFDVANGTVTKIGRIGITFEDSGIIDAGNGWYRCWIRGTGYAGSVGYNYLGPSNSGTPDYGSYGTLSFTGDGTSGIWVWGVKVEQGVLSEYIPQ